MLLQWSLFSSLNKRICDFGLTTRKLRQERETTFTPTYLLELCHHRGQLLHVTTILPAYVLAHPHSI